MRLRRLPLLSSRATPVVCMLAATLICGGPSRAQAAGFSPDYPAQPMPGMLYWGAAVAGNGDPTERHEVPAGASLSVRRTFFRWDQRTAAWMIGIVNSDHANGRLPWVSFKTPTWAHVAAGLHDAEIDQLLNILGNTGKPIWLTIWHEPENNLDVGTPADHLAMNRRVRERMDALGVNNIALVQILMVWTWNPASGRNPNVWWEPGVYDLLGVDHYRNSETSLLTSVWFDVRAWAAARGLDLAVGEWGMRGTDHAAGERVREWYEAAAESHHDGLGARVVALAAFDSHLNSPSGSWELQGHQLSVFHELLADPRTARFTGPPLAASFTASPLSGHLPLAVQFTDNSTGAIDAWSWTFGDGATDSARSPQHTYTTPGVYDVSLAVTGIGTDVETKAGYIHVLPQRGDFDGDGDLDQSDFGRVQACLTGPAVPYTDPSCSSADFDDDGDVDAADLTRFLQCLSGPNVAADPDCAN